MDVSGRGQDEGKRVTRAGYATAMLNLPDPMIQKNGRTLTTLDEWRDHAGPKRPGQWKDGRSAKESGRAWIDALPGLPPEVVDVLAQPPDLGPLQEWEAEPEAQVHFDDHGGPANLDVLLKGRDDRGSIVVAIEAKADESFGPTIQGAWAAAEKRLDANPRSRGIARLKQLLDGVLGVAMQDREAVGHLRYQLLTATAALLAGPADDGPVRRVLLVHEFVTDQTTDQRHAANNEDLAAFVSILSGGREEQVEPGQLVGPFEVPGGPGWAGNGFWIGKAVRRLRGG